MKVVLCRLNYFLTKLHPPSNGCFHKHKFQACIKSLLLGIKTKTTKEDGICVSETLNCVF